MKILGFNFDSSSTVERHIQEVCKKFRKCLWFLRHLSKAVKNKKELVDCYTVFLRPIVEYCMNVYHPMLNITQSNLLEKLQISALKVIFGYDKSSEVLLEMSGLPPLQARRENLSLIHI